MLITINLVQLGMIVVILLAVSFVVIRIIRKLRTGNKDLMERNKEIANKSTGWDQTRFDLEEEIKKKDERIASLGERMQLLANDQAVSKRILRDLLDKNPEVFVDLESLPNGEYILHGNYGSDYYISANGSYIFLQVPPGFDLARFVEYGKAFIKKDDGLFLKQSPFYVTRN